MTCMRAQVCYSCRTVGGRGRRVVPATHRCNASGLTGAALYLCARHAVERCSSLLKTIADGATRLPDAPAAPAVKDDKYTLRFNPEVVVTAVDHENKTITTDAVAHAPKCQPDCTPGFPCMEDECPGWKEQDPFNDGWMLVQHGISGDWPPQRETRVQSREWMAMQGRWNGREPRISRNR